MLIPRAFVLLLALAAASLAQDEAKLLRFPAIRGDRIVFTFAGDLYTVGSQGGIARRLTSHDGFEMFARFSPDGKWIAFTGQYDGNTEVYLIPSDGGVPKRLTWTATLGRDDVSDRMGPNNIVMGWTPDSTRIVFRSRGQTFNPFVGKLYTVPLAGGLPEPLPLPAGGFCSYSPDGKRLAYNRIFREFRTWKRYRGGMADDVWIHDFDRKTTQRITTGEASDIIPMWVGHRVFFLSDRGDNVRMNLYAHDTITGATTQLTIFADFDCKFPSASADAIVFENGGDLYRYDLAAGKAAKVPVRILDDRAAARGGLRNVSKEIAGVSIAPDGKRAVLSARGDLFTVPAKTGPTRNLTGTPGVHDRAAEWSPDGKAIAYISDESGEDEIHLRPADGKGPAQQLTQGADTYKYELVWSPDGSKIAFTDKKLRLQFLDVKSKQVTVVDTGESWEIRDFAWSPDSQWIAYSRQDTRGPNRVKLYSLEARKSTAVTDTWFDAYSPAFSGDGKYLFLVSDRDFNPVYSRTEWNHAYRDMAGVYALVLAKDTPSPLAPRSDEVGVEVPKAEPPKKGAAIRVDLDGLEGRLLKLPVPAAGYGRLGSAGSAVWYVRRGQGKAQLAVFDLADRKETVLGPADGFEISADGKKMLVVAEGKHHIVDLPKTALALGSPLDVSGLEVTLDRKAEWAQIQRECWRQMRDFFYVPNMHGVDWQAVRRKYEPLVAHVEHRADLTYIIGEMIGELNCGHTYVGGGDMPHPNRISTGLLGAEFTRDPQTGYFRIQRILRGANWDGALRSPLTEIGVDASEGDWIVAVDGKPANELLSPLQALVGKAGKSIVLRLNAKPVDAGARETTVVPISDESSLYYHTWVRTNIDKVSKATDGKVGYLHVPDMQQTGLNEFAKHFYPQLGKSALIIDMRGNGGGNVSPMLIDRLRREIAMVSVARNTVPNPNPREAVLGPMICILNEYSASDGDLFPYRFRQHKLGKLVGRRSWGGVVGIRGTLPLLDGGFLNKPEFAPYDLEGRKWIIEGRGVEPDIDVENDPSREMAGIDDQLDRAIREILEELKTKHRPLPPVPAPPVK